MTSPAGIPSTEEIYHLLTSTLNRFVGWKLIGTGTSGSVYEAIDPETRKHLAIKESQVSSHGITSMVMVESFHMQRLNHPRLLRSWDLMCHPNMQVYETFEFCSRGDLSNHYASIASNPYKLKRVCFQLAQVVSYLHNEAIVHRDLKPENVLLDSNSDVKLCDLGVACTEGVGERLRFTEVGTLIYRAPELLCGFEDYGSSIDVWSLGVIFAQLAMCGRCPFENKYYNSHVQMFCLQRIIGTPTAETFPELWKRFEQLPSYWQHFLRSGPKFPRLPFRWFVDIPTDLGDLLDKMLTWSPSQRLSMNDVLRHPFFRGVPQYDSKRSVRLQNRLAAFQSWSSRDTNRLHSPSSFERFVELRFAQMQHKRMPEGIAFDVDSDQIAPAAFAVASASLPPPDPAAFASATKKQSLLSTLQLTELFTCLIDMYYNSTSAPPTCQETRDYVHRELQYLMSHVSYLGLPNDLLSEFYAAATTVNAPALSAFSEAILLEGSQLGFWNAPGVSFEEEADDATYVVEDMGRGGVERDVFELECIPESYWDREEDEEEEDD